MHTYIPGKPVAHNCGLLYTDRELLWGKIAYNYGLLSINDRLVWRIVARDFGQLGFPIRQQDESNSA